MSTHAISKILYRHDPGKTGCNVCEDMENEYDRLAAEIAAVPVMDLTAEAFRAILAESFFDDLLDNDAVSKSHQEILNL